MTLAVLDINDCNLQLWAGSQHAQGAGYALFSKGDYQFGNDARARARLEPRSTNTRYWWQLNTEPLQPALGPARHSADLVHAHLQALHSDAGRPEQVVLAVPGSLQRDQLALLLGIVQACPFNATGLVNRSVAAASLLVTSERAFHLELQLHQATITELSADGDTITAPRTQPLPGCGMLQLQERLVELIAAAFIRQTRFDPRRKADTEQALYDMLPKVLAQLRSTGETIVEVSGNRASISRSALTEAGSRLFTSAAEAIGANAAHEQILLDPIVALLPGIDGHFANNRVLAEDSVNQAVQQHRSVIEQSTDELVLTGTLPCEGMTIRPNVEALADPVPPARREGKVPTHLLVGQSAYALGGRNHPLAMEATQETSGDWVLSTDASGHTTLNDNPYAGENLVVGDTLVSEGTTALLIEVLS